MTLSTYNTAATTSVSKIITGTDSVTVSNASYVVTSSAVASKAECADETISNERTASIQRKELKPRITVKQQKGPTKNTTTTIERNTVYDIIVDSQEANVNHLQHNAVLKAEYVPPYATWPANLAAMHNVNVECSAVEVNNGAYRRRHTKMVKKPKQKRRYSFQRQETVQREQYVTENMPIYEKVIETGQRIRVDKTVSVPEIQIDEYEVIRGERNEIRERIIEVKKPVYVDKIVEVPAVNPTMVEKIVEYTEIQYRDIPVERIVEVPEIREEVVIVEKRVPQYVEVPVPQTISRVKESNVVVPVPVEEATIVEYQLDTIVPRHHLVKYQIFLPRFVEVPIATECATEQEQLEAAHLQSEMQSIIQTQSATHSISNLGRLEAFAEKVHGANIVGQCDRRPLDHLALLNAAYDRGQIVVEQQQHAF